MGGSCLSVSVDQQNPSRAEMEGYLRSDIAVTVHEAAVLNDKYDKRVVYMTFLILEQTRTKTRIGCLKSDWLFDN